ncbi:hypothetical protein HJG60_011268 [Phyllostomus discolor]|uniref:Uncharacterized protein n=1 Tax=Phyllostomus discolor TaxID=89673 RepID=A0A834E1L5_9CHIR|nr:hypothetical protein HJG60_011268 [Phyllostomus discolor]
MGEAPEREQCSSPACPQRLVSSDSCVRLDVSPNVATVVSTLSFSYHFYRPHTTASPAPKVHWLSSVFLHQPDLSVHRLTSLVVLIDFFSLIPWLSESHAVFFFWYFWLFIDFRLVVILLLVVQGSKGFLPIPPSWLVPI